MLETLKKRLIKIVRDNLKAFAGFPPDLGRISIVVYTTCVSFRLPGGNTYN